MNTKYLSLVDFSTVGTFLIIFTNFIHTKIVTQKSENIYMQKNVIEKYFKYGRRSVLVKVFQDNSARLKSFGCSKRKKNRHGQIFQKYMIILLKKHRLMRSVKLDGVPALNLILPSFLQRIQHFPAFRTSHVRNVEKLNFGLHCINNNKLSEYPGE